MNVLNAILASVTGRTRVQNSEISLMSEQSFTIEIDTEVDGRWIAEIASLPGVMAFGETKQEAIANAEAIALRVLADRLEQAKVGMSSVSFATASAMGQAPKPNASLLPSRKLVGRSKLESAALIDRWSIPNMARRPSASMIPMRRLARR